MALFFLIYLQAIEFECVRIEHRETEMNEKMTKLSAEIKAVKYNRNDMSEEEHTKYVLKLKRNKQKEEYYYGVMCRKQDKLLFVAFYILLNLAEDPTVERKMLKKDLINQLNCKEKIICSS